MVARVAMTEQRPDVDILFEDEYLIVVNKPAGIGTQAPRQFDSLEARIRMYLASPDSNKDSLYLGVPHRLDRCSSGAIVFAKRKKAAQRLAKQFERRSVQEDVPRIGQRPSDARDRRVVRHTAQSAG